MDSVTEVLNPHRPPRYLAGLDLGQLSDPTALVVAERQMTLARTGRMEPRFVVRFLERVPLGTAYPLVVRGVRRRLTALGEPCTLVVDVTGVGRGPYDLFRDPVSAEVQEVEAAYHAVFRLPRALTPIAVSFTAGQQVRQVEGRWQEWHVPRLTLIMMLVVALQQERVWLPETPEAHALKKEAQDFRWRPTVGGEGDDSPWREQAHDDLLFALAILVWYGTRFAPTYAHEGTDTTHYATLPGNPLRTPLAARGSRGRY